MGRYALVWTTNLGYMPGTNGILNALEYYKFPEDLDKYILVWEDNGFSWKHDYWKSWNVQTVHIEPDFSDGRNSYWNMVFKDFLYALKSLFHYYDVVLFWGADVCPLNNFSEYFDICKKLDTIILSHNEQGNQSYNAMSEQKPYGHTWDVPFADIPLFVPKSHREAIYQTVDLQDGQNKTDRMDGLNYAIRDLNMKPFVLPGMLWVHNVPGRLKIWNGGNGDYYCWNQRMNSFHRKYWSSAFCDSYIQSPNEVSNHNISLFNKAWNFFNKECRVKWQEGIDSWISN